MTTPLANATPRELAALGCYWLDLWCLRSPRSKRAATERIEVSAEGYTITRVTPDEDSTSSTYTLPHGFSGGRARVRVPQQARARERVRIEESL